MTLNDKRRIEKIITELETLQRTTKDEVVQDRAATAKNEMLKIKLY